MSANRAILIDRKTAASLLGISIGSLDKLRRRRVIEPVFIGKKVMFRRDHIEELALTATQKKALRSLTAERVQ